MLYIKVRILHQVQLVNRIDETRAEIGDDVVWIGMLITRRAGRLQLEIVEWQRIGVIVQLIEIAAIQGQIRATEAIIRIMRVVCEGAEMEKISTGKDYVITSQIFILPTIGRERQIRIQRLTAEATIA